MVYGNCGMCEKTIEGSLKNVEGVTLADWDKETDQMKVTFNSDLINLDAIKQRIADVGYDSETHRAKEEVYNKLPGCCQYERPKN
ncbi:MAG: heavy-metal-associated domain-containing protein [Bacteroidetes bacterium]|nr:heavy-metal-associated domain-containing protein [Bacteroidota bacterium]NNC86193.1 heavy-metal-associated domain-containing protein [Bacteroidia bacterium]